MDEYANTIVGGRGAESTTRQSFPRGIEVLLKKAKADRRFRDRLLNDPFEAAESIELVLSDTEQLILRHVPRDVLNVQIENIRIPARLTPIYRTAKTAASLLAIVAFSALTPNIAATAGCVEAPLEVDDALGATVERLHLIQDALERYREVNGQYPTTEQWEEQSSMLEFVSRANLYDPWYNAFEYEGEVENAKVVNYLLRSRGGTGDLFDDIPCPVDPAKHAFGPLLEAEFPAPKPTENTRFQLASGEDAEFILSVVIPNPDGTLLWVLDGNEIEATTGEHAITVPLALGEHVVRVVAEDGRTAARIFETPSAESLERSE